MPSPNDMRAQAASFAKRWYNETRERAEKDTFWNEFFNIFGVDRRRVAAFEAGYRKKTGSTAYIDVFWPGTLLCEHKSAGKDLDAAEIQAREYLREIERHNPEDLPRYIIVSDFAHMRLINLDGKHEPINFDLLDLPKHIGAFGFISGHEQQIRREEEAASIAAAEKMGQLYDAIHASGYDEHALKFLLIRLLFCLFAEDTGIFDQGQFEQFIRNRTQPDGSDLAEKLNTLFYNLNTPSEKRLKTLDETIAQFPYINGALFAEYLPPAAFNREMRNALLSACELDWSKISPEIFGAMFQSVMDSEARRALGAHYTEEANILKVVNGLFMDDLRAELIAIVHKKQPKAKKEAALDTFHNKIANLKLLDPACGCGNFLVVAYRELRLLELETITALHGDKQMQLLDLDANLRCHVGQCYGIEIEEFPALIARLALWLTDHQQNLIASETFGRHYARIPLTDSAHITQGNALAIEWPAVDYILGNPPFIGKTYQTPEQKADQQATLSPYIKTFAGLDYVANWYIKAAGYLKNGFSDGIKPQAAAFVSTNSITQGEQAPLLWGCLNKLGMHILFAYRTFPWTSAARGKAAVHCVIIGFSPTNRPQKYLFDSPTAEPKNTSASDGAVSDGINAPATASTYHSVDNINGYLIAAPDVYLGKSRQQISGELEMIYGSKPTDGGNLLLSPEEKQALVAAEPEAAHFIRPFMGAEEFLNDKTRYCLWFADIDEGDLADALVDLPEVNRRIAAVRAMRLASIAAATQKTAETPHLFFSERQPRQGNYLIIPEVSSENRYFLPMDYVSHETVASNLVYILPQASLYHFGILMSTMHNAFMRTVAGRLKSDYRYSNGVVYNNFPYPFTAAERLAAMPSENQTAHAAAEEMPSENRQTENAQAPASTLPAERLAQIRQHLSNIEAAAQAVLDARAYYRSRALEKDKPAPTLAQLYNPPATSIDPYGRLRQAHAKLDAAVDAAYRSQAFENEAERVAFLFDLHQQTASKIKAV